MSTCLKLMHACMIIVAIPRDTNAIPPVPMAEPMPPKANTLEAVWPANLIFL